MKDASKGSSQDKYNDLLAQARSAKGRKEAVRLIHRADKARIEVEEDKEGAK